MSDTERHNYEGWVCTNCGAYVNIDIERCICGVTEKENYEAGRHILHLYVSNRKDGEGDE